MLRGLIEASNYFFKRLLAFCFSKSKCNFDLFCFLQQAVALVNSLFVWNAGDGSITELFTRESTTDTITAVSW